MDYVFECNNLVWGHDSSNLVGKDGESEKYKQFCLCFEGRNFLIDCVWYERGGKNEHKNFGLIKYLSMELLSSEME